MGTIQHKWHISPQSCSQECGHGQEWRSGGQVVLAISDRMVMATCIICGVQSAYPAFCRSFQWKSSITRGLQAATKAACKSLALYLLDSPLMDCMQRTHYYNYRTCMPVPCVCLLLFVCSLLVSLSTCVLFVLFSTRLFSKPQQLQKITSITLYNSFVLQTHPLCRPGILHANQCCYNVLDQDLSFP